MNYSVFYYRLPVIQCCYRNAFSNNIHIGVCIQHNGVHIIRETYSAHTELCWNVGAICTPSYQSTRRHSRIHITCAATTVGTRSAPARPPGPHEPNMRDMHSGVFLMHLAAAAAAVVYYRISYNHWTNNYRSNTYIQYTRGAAFECGTESIDGIMYTRGTRLYINAWASKRAWENRQTIIIDFIILRCGWCARASGVHVCYRRARIDQWCARPKSNCAPRVAAATTVSFAVRFVLDYFYISVFRWIKKFEISDQIVFFFVRQIRFVFHLFWFLSK